MQGTVGRIVLGFIAAVISVLIVHQTIVYVLGMYGMSRSVPWSMKPIGYGWFPWVPTIVNVAFWGGLWGILFGLIYNWLPSGMAWLKGLVFGCLIVLISNWTLLPLIRQYGFNYPRQPLFSGLDPMVMLAVVLIVGGFGLGLGIIYGLIGPRDETA